MKIEKQLVLQANIINRDGICFTEECLQNIAKDSKKVNVTECFTKRALGVADNFIFENGNLYVDMDIDENKIRPKEIYPCVKILIKEKEDKENYIEMQKGILTQIGLCVENANQNIPAIILNIEGQNDK
jgi:hypothetical protein